MSTVKSRVAFHTFGCKLNFSETSAMSRKLEENSFIPVSFNEEAEIYVIHGCTVTESADRKCRQAINKILRRSPDSFIVVAGCYAQLRHREIAAIPGVDLVLGTGEKYDIVKYLQNIEKRSKTEVHNCETDQIRLFNSSYSMGDRTRSFLKVQDGCNYNCSYCTIPRARGRSRNQPVIKCVDDAKRIAEKGIKEIVLTGVNIGDFGRSTGESFLELLEGLVKVDGIERYRISSVEPDLLSDEIIEFAAHNRKIMPHFHLPLQSGNNGILGKMRRRYTREVFTSRVNKIRKEIPPAGIGADVITGFPGEGEDEFNDTYRFLEDTDVSYLHVFSYSKRSGTPAALMDEQVDKKVRNLRSKKLQALSEKKKMLFNNKCKGTCVEILWESEEKPGLIAGFTGNYIRVFTKYQPALEGRISKHILRDIDENANFVI